MAKLRLAELVRRRVLLLDGAMGTSLMARGLSAGECAELWNIERPEAVLEVLQSYVAAGSQVLQTNTFGASPTALARHGLEDRATELNAAGVRLARSVPGDALVAGNIGPSGRLLEPYGDASPTELENGYREQAIALADAGADYLSIETMIQLREAVVAVRAARSTGLEVTACMTYDRRPKGFFTAMGERPAECAARLVDEGATLVGANCTLSSGDMLVLCAELVETAQVPVIVKPNAGLPDMVRGRAVYGQDPSEFARDMVTMAEMGARAVGGCCGTDEGFIRCLAKQLDSSLASSELEHRRPSS